MKAMKNNKDPRKRQQKLMFRTSSVSDIIFANGSDCFSFGNCTKETAGHNAFGGESYTTLRNTLASPKTLIWHRSFVDSVIHCVTCAVTGYVERLLGQTRSFG